MVPAATAPAATMPVASSAMPAAVAVPVLRKDFIFDPWQVWEARSVDADSFLLIAAILSDARLAELLAAGRELGMEPLVEVHTRAEVDRALSADARILGVNNRDLKTLEFHLLDAGHFALETNGDEIAKLMRDFLGKHVKK